MPEDPGLAAMREYYERGLEAGRLAETQGLLEFERTKEIILRHLPPPPAVVADIGGGPGRYALWLAGLGYQVVHRDLMPQGAFCGYTHRPGQLRAELAASGLTVTGVVGVEGPAYLLADLDERLADDDDRRVVLETARALERVPELLGIGPHLLATAIRPLAGPAVP